MALLQAASYYLLKGDLNRAKSFGLNRAIFYAWAKGSGGRPAERRLELRPNRYHRGLGSSWGMKGPTLTSRGSRWGMMSRDRGT